MEINKRTIDCAAQRVRDFGSGKGLIALDDIRYLAHAAKVLVRMAEWLAFGRDMDDHIERGESFRIYCERAEAELLKEREDGQG